MEDQIWDKERHELRTRTDQRFKAQHAERRVSLTKKRDDVSIWRRRAHMKRHETVSGVAAKDRSGIGEDVGNAQEPHDRSQAMNAMRSWADKKVNWQKIEAGSHPSPPASPHTQSSSAKGERLVREGRRRAISVISRKPLPKSPANRVRTNQGIFPKVKHGLDLVPEHQPAESEHSESSHDEDSQNPSLPGDGDSHQGLFEHTNRHAEEHYPQRSQQKGVDDDHDPQIRTSDSGCRLCDEAKIRQRNFSLCDDAKIRRNLSDQQRRDHVPLSKIPIIDQSIDETDDGEKLAVSDKSKKPNEQETSSETPPDLNEYEHHSTDVQLPPSELKAPLIDASPGYIPDGDHSDQEVYEAEEAPESPPTPGIIDKLDPDSQPMSPRSDHMEHLDPQTSPFWSQQNKSPYTIQNPDTTRSAGDESPDAQQTSPSHNSMKSPNQQSKSHGDDHLKSPGWEFKSPESGGVSINAIPIQDRVSNDDDAEARLKSDAPMGENDRASFYDSQRHRSSRPDRSYDAGDDKDSLIVSPARSVRYPCSIR